MPTAAKRTSRTTAQSRSDASLKVTASFNFITVSGQPEDFILQVVGGGVAAGEEAQEAELARLVEEAEGKEKEGTAQDEGKGGGKKKKKSQLSKAKEAELRAKLPPLRVVPHTKRARAVFNPRQQSWSATVWCLDDVVPYETTVWRPLYDKAQVEEKRQQQRQQECKKQQQQQEGGKEQSQVQTSASPGAEKEEVEVEDPAVAFDTANSTPKASARVMTKEAPLASGTAMAASVVDTRLHFQHPQKLECYFAQPEDCMYGILPIGMQQLYEQFLFPTINQMFHDAIFLLPQEKQPMVCCMPNSAKRFCIDLTYRRHVPQQQKKGKELTPPLPTSGDAAPPISEGAADPATGKPTVAAVNTEGLPVRWDRNKKVRKVLPSVRLAVNRNFAQTLTAISEYHKERDRGVWLGEEFIDVLVQMQKRQSAKYGTSLSSSSFAAAAAAGEPLLMTFELYDSTGTTLLAAIAGFAHGQCFHDYTMATFNRTGHACYGTLLTKLTGDTLTRCGYQLWYWGMRLGYMTEFEDHYGGVDIPRKEFYPKWSQLRGVAPAVDIGSLLQSGQGLVQGL